MSGAKTFHLSKEAAESYECQKVPSIFGPMAEATLDAIDLPEGGDVLDVACGTGVVARAIAGRLTQPSRIVGADLNAAMVDIAVLNTPDTRHEFDWIVAPADNLPFDTSSFDLAFCQHGLQFFPDKPAALTEMHRVLRPGGRLILTCWAAIPPFFEIVAGVLRTHLNATAATTAVAPFVWNDATLIGQLLEDAGYQAAPARRLPVFRRMSASTNAIRADLLATPNEPAYRKAGEKVTAIIMEQVLAQASRYREGNTLVMPQEAHLFEATSPGWS